MPGIKLFSIKMPSIKLFSIKIPGIKLLVSTNLLLIYTKAFIDMTVVYFECGKNNIKMFGFKLLCMHFQFKQFRASFRELDMETLIFKKIF